MGLFDWLTGTKRPEKGVVPRSPQEVHQALVGLNRPDVPFVVRDGRPEGVDLVSEWRIMDPGWHEYFRAFSVTKTYKILMRLDPSGAEVRSTDHSWEIDWTRGFPQVKQGMEFERGQVNRVERRWTIGRDKDGDLGVRDTATFSGRDLKSPLQDTVTSLGWTWSGVAFGRL